MALSDQLRINKALLIVSNKKKEIYFQDYFGT